MFIAGIHQLSANSEFIYRAEEAPVDEVIPNASTVRFRLNAQRLFALGVFVFSIMLCRAVKLKFDTPTNRSDKLKFVTPVLGFGRFCAIFKMAQQLITRQNYFGQDD